MNTALILTVTPPAATFIGIGAQRFVVADEPTSVTGRVFVAASADPATETSIIGDFEVWPPDPPGAPLLAAAEHGPVPLPEREPTGDPVYDGWAQHTGHMGA